MLFSNRVITPEADKPRGLTVHAFKKDDPFRGHLRVFKKSPDF